MSTEGGSLVVEDKNDQDLEYQDDLTGEEETSLIPADERKLAFWMLPRIRGRWGYAVALYLNTILGIAILFTIFAIVLALPRVVYLFYYFEELAAPEGNRMSFLPHNNEVLALSAKFGVPYVPAKKWCVDSFEQSLPLLFEFYEFFRRFTFASMSYLSFLQSFNIVFFLISFPYLYSLIIGSLYFKNMANLTSARKQKFEDFNLYFRFSRDFYPFYELDRGVNYSDELRDYLVESGFNVEKVMFMPSSVKYLKIFKKMLSIGSFRNSLVRKIPLVNILYGFVIKHAPSSLDGIDEKLSSLEEEKKNYESKNLTSSFAVVTFRTPVDSYRAYQYFGCPFKVLRFFGPIRDVANLFFSKKFKDAKISVYLAEKNTSVVWENLYVSTWQRILRYLFMFTFATIIVVIGVLLVIPFYFYSASIDAGFTYYGTHDVVIFLFSNPLFDILFTLIVFLMSFIVSRLLRMMARIPRHIRMSARRTTLIGLAIAVRCMPIVGYYIVFQYYAFAGSFMVDNGDRWGMKCAYHKTGFRLFLLGLVPILVGAPVIPFLINVLFFFISVIKVRGRVTELSRWSYFRKAKFEFMPAYAKIYMYLLIGYIMYPASPITFVFLTVFFWVYYVMERINFCLFYNTANLTGRFASRIPKFNMLFPLITAVLFLPVLISYSYYIDVVLYLLLFVFLPLCFPVPVVVFSIQSFLYTFFGNNFFKIKYIMNLKKSNTVYDPELHGTLITPFACLSSTGPASVDDDIGDESGAGAQEMLPVVEQQAPQLVVQQPPVQQPMQQPPVQTVVVQQPPAPQVPNVNITVQLGQAELIPPAADPAVQSEEY